MPSLLPPPPRPTLISASRRTDIPAFHGEWLRTRLRAGWCEVENPFSGQVSRVSLAPRDVLAWVFWSRHYAPVYDVLEGLYAGGQRFLCHFTINGFPRILEPRTPPADLSTATARRLAADFGAEVVLWRYDPILLTSVTPPEWHLANFRALCQALEGHTRRCLFSFPTLYRKTLRNLGRLEASGALRVWSPTAGDFTRADLAALLGELVAIASGHGIALQACCCEPWVREQPGVGAAQCIDWPLLERLGAGGHLWRADWTKQGQAIPDTSPNQTPLTGDNTPEEASGEAMPVPEGTIPGGPEGLPGTPEDLFGAAPPVLSVKRRPTRPGCGCYQAVDIGAYHTCAHGCAYCYAVDDPAAAMENLRNRDTRSSRL